MDGASTGSVTRRFVVGVLLLFAVAVGRDLRGTVAAVTAPETLEGTERAEGYRFIAEHPDGTPVRWDPCASVRWELDVASLPSPEAGAVVEGFMATAALDARMPALVFVGETDRSASAAMGGATGRDGVDLPVLVGFGDTQAQGRDERTIGLGGPLSQVVDGEWQHTSGRILLDTEAWPTLSPLTQRRVVLHELLHVLGLDHTEADGQLMAPGYAHALGAGDLAGIAALRGDGCGS